MVPASRSSTLALYRQNNESAGADQIYGFYCPGLQQEKFSPV